MYILELKDRTNLNNKWVQLQNRGDTRKESVKWIPKIT